MMMAMMQKSIFAFLLIGKSLTLAHASHPSAQSSIKATASSRMAEVVYPGDENNVVSDTCDDGKFLSLREVKVYRKYLCSQKTRWGH